MKFPFSIVAEIMLMPFKIIANLYLDQLIRKKKINDTKESQFTVNGMINPFLNIAWIN